MDKTLKYTIAYLCNLAFKVYDEYKEQKESDDFDTSVFYDTTNDDRMIIETLMYIVSLRLKADSMHYYPTLNKIEIRFNLHTHEVIHEVDIDNFEDYITNQILD